jgi:DNA-binding transcriptional LysR family regulator
MVVRDETFETLGRRIRDSAVDLGLTYDLGLPSHFARILLHELRPHALLPAGHPLADRPAVSLADLAAYPLITTDQPQSWQHMLDLFLSRGLSPVADITTSSFELQRSMVANGFGVAVSYTRPHGDRSYDGLPLVCKSLSDPLPMQKIILTHDTRQRLSNAAMAFIEVAKDWFSRHDVFTS